MYKNKPNGQTLVDISFWPYCVDCMRGSCFLVTLGKLILWDRQCGVMSQENCAKWLCPDYVRHTVCHFCRTCVYADTDVDGPGGVVGEAGLVHGMQQIQRHRAHFAHVVLVPDGHTWPRTRCKKSMQGYQLMMKE